MERGSRVFAEFGEDIYMIEVGGCDAGEIDASACVCVIERRESDMILINSLIFVTRIVLRILNKMEA